MARARADRGDAARDDALGYGHPDYARSLAEFGTPRRLERCDGWVIERPIAGGPEADAIGCYPLFRCRDWSGLRADIHGLDGEVVAVSMVPDLFGDYDEAYLRECFGDLVVPFKEHFVIDMHRPLVETVSRHHRKYARKALRDVEVDVLEDPRAFLDEWVALHENLVARYDIRGIRAFSRQAFSIQLDIPGMTVVRGRHRGETVGAQLWLRHADVAYGHVLAFTQRGYELLAPYALYWSSLELFSGRVRWCAIGGVAGVGGGSGGGLSQFKKGWATDRRTAWFCGRVTDRPTYNALAGRSGPASGNFFPAYRTTF